MIEFNLKRNYKDNPLKLVPREKFGGLILEKPYKEDLEYLISLSLSLKELSEYFNVNEKTVRKWKKFYNIKTNWVGIRNNARKTYKNINNIDLYDHNKIKSKTTKLKKYNDENYNNRNKAKQKCLEKYGVEYFLQSKKYKDLYKDKDWYKQIRTKIDNTKRNNKSFTNSKEETEIYEILKTKFLDVKRQYKNDLYPYSCDFYIPSIDTYIEYQGYWMHGKEPYIGTEEQQDIIKKWKEKGTSQYLRAVKYWSEDDVKKRNDAKVNNIKLLEFFNRDQFKKWFNKI